MDFSPPAGGKLGSVQKEQMMDQVKQQIALANAQELLQKCIAMCMDRYMDSWNLVSRIYSQRLQKERAKMH